MRRTSTLDVLLGPDLAGPLAVVGHARDVRTDPDGTAGELRRLALDATIDDSRVVTGVRVDPADTRVADLAGHELPFGFRAAVASRLTLEPEDSLLVGLLDDVPMVMGITNYARLAAGRPYRGRPAATKVDICSGYREGGTMLTRLEGTGRRDLGGAPPAPDLRSPTDPAGWHDLPPLPAHSMRRMRRIDLVAGSPMAIHGVFRDSHMGPEGREVVVHEYTFEGAVDGPDLRLVAMTATPRVLPYPECPAAAASAATLTGRPVAGVRDGARRALRGTASCTHLTDLLANLAGVAEMARSLADDEPRSTPEPS